MEQGFESGRSLPTGDATPPQSPSEVVINRSRTAWLFALLGCSFLACYVGFRLPGAYSLTFYNVSWFDGITRRALFGTVLGPLWSGTDHSYWAQALVSFVVLLALLVVILRQALRARFDSQRILVCAWLIAPTGAFLFYEVANFEQVVYLLLFASMWLWLRVPRVVAMLPLLVAVLVHELALLTAWPFMVWYVWRAAPGIRRNLAVLVPLLGGVLVSLRPSLSAEAANDLEAVLNDRVEFPVPVGVLRPFISSVTEVWAFYSPVRGLGFVGPIALVLVLVCIAIMWRTGTRTVSRSSTLLAVGACCAPLTLSLVAYDNNRWVFLAFANFTMVGFFWLSSRAEEASAVVVASWVLPLSLLFYYPALTYIDGASPRSLSPGVIVEYLKDPGSFAPLVLNN